MTIKDIARLAGVTHSTVSRSLNDSPLVSDATKERIKKIAADHGYSPNAFARRLVTRESRTLGVFFLSRDEIRFMENFGTQFLDGIARRSNEEGYDLLFFTMTRDRSADKSYLRLCREKHVEGVIFIGMTSDDPHLGELPQADIPVCVIDYPVEGAQVGYVTSDNDRGIRLALEHLWALGHRDIGFVGGPEVSPVALVREATYRTWMTERGLEARRRVWRGDFTKASGLARGAEIAADRSRPTALVAANDYMALGLLRAFRERGLAVPDALSLVGYDNAAAGEHSDPGLTTVGQNAEAMGARAVDFLLASLRGQSPERSIRIDPALVVRETTGPAHG